MPLEFDFKTKIPIEKILEKLKKNKFKVEISNDPGRFICNYLYYLSLKYGNDNDVPTLFVHVINFISLIYLIFNNIKF